jgi:hypothetical protein
MHSIYFRAACNKSFAAPLHSPERSFLWYVPPHLLCCACVSTSQTLLKSMHLQGARSMVAYLQGSQRTRL